MGNKKITRKFEIINSDNPARNFEVVVKELESVAKEDGSPVQEVIREFIKALQNPSNELDEKNSEEFNIISDLSEPARNAFISYLNKAISRFDSKEKRKKIEAAKQERANKKNEEKKQVESVWQEIKNLTDNSQDSDSKIAAIKETIRSIEEKDTYSDLGDKQRKEILVRLDKLLQQEENKKNKKAKAVNKSWNEIKGIVEKQSNNDNRLNAKYWGLIKNCFFGEDKDQERFDIEIPNSIKEEVKVMIEEETYYQQVKYFTDDFRFLSEEIEIIAACNGSFNRKFTDKDSFNRFYDLRSKIQKGRNEYEEISRMLNEKHTEEADRRILAARLEVLNKQKDSLGR